MHQMKLCIDYDNGDNDPRLSHTLVCTSLTDLLVLWEMTRLCIPLGWKYVCLLGGDAI